MNGIFAVEKPSGITSTQFITKIQHILTKSEGFQKEVQVARKLKIEQYKHDNKGKHPPNRILNRVSKVKMGHGGTLDPLASGVLVVGIGKGTKELANYLHGTVKCYEAEALLGLSTTSGDCEPNGEIISVNSVKHLVNKTPEEKLAMIEELTSKFKGHLKQTPPIFAALKMNGKPLHEYAREGIPLPKPIEPREVEIYDLDIIEKDFFNREHDYKFLKLDQEDEEFIKNLAKLNTPSASTTPSATQLYYSDEYCEKAGLEKGVPVDLPTDKKNIISDPTNEEFKEMSNTEVYKAPLFHFVAKVSSGTYIRSLIDDMGKALGSSAYMVSLKRISQQNWNLEQNNVFKLEDFENRDEKVWSKVLSKILEHGSTVDIRKEFEIEQKNFDESPKEEPEQEFKEEESKEEGSKDEEPPTKKLKTSENTSSPTSA